MLTHLLAFEIIGDGDVPPVEDGTPAWRTVRVDSGGIWTPKDPDDVVDYALDWGSWLAGDTLSTSTWLVENVAVSGVLVATSAINLNRTIVWLTAGDAGRRARIRNRITTAGGRTFDKTMLLQIRER